MQQKVSKYAVGQSEEESQLQRITVINTLDEYSKNFQACYCNAE